MNVKEKINQWFEHFHAHPEVSWKEVETTAKLAEILTDMGVKHHTFDDVTGVVAEIGEGDRVIAVRADIDALWQEVGGVYQANHSCGHDANISMVLGALSYLQKEQLGSRIRFIFQPAEEKGNGANSMIERGVVDGVSQMYGVHLRPQEEIPFGKVTPAIHHGAAVFLEGQITGVDAYSAKLTKVQAGGDSLNIIPGTATFAIDARSQSNTVLIELKDRIDEGIQAIGKLYDVAIDLVWSDYTPAAEVSEEAAAIAKEAILEIVGEEGYAPAIITSGSDDFHFYTIHQPELKAAMIGIGADLGPGLHHPDMTFNREALDIGARVLTATLQKASYLKD